TSITGSVWSDPATGSAPKGRRREERIGGRRRGCGDRWWRDRGRVAGVRAGPGRARRHRARGVGGVRGPREARELGVETIMLDAGAHITPLWKQYMEGFGEAGDIPMHLFVEGFDGTLNLRHPVACQALIDAAAGAGATVVRGARDVKLSGNGTPRVAYRRGGDTFEVDTSLVVGADGRASTIRKQAGIELERQEPVNF